MLKDSTDFIIFLIFRIYLGDSGIHGRENVVKSYSRLVSKNVQNNNGNKNNGVVC